MTLPASWERVVAGLVSAIHGFDIAVKRRGCPTFAGHDDIVSVGFERVNVNVGRYHTIEAADMERIRFSGPDDPLARVADPSLLPDGYQVVAETAVDRMGVHAIDTAAAEVRGEPFTATLIHGYYDGAPVFIEPMVTRDFLLSKPDCTAAVKKPGHISQSGHYPASYEVGYGPAGQTWRIGLTGLEYRADTAAGAR